MRRAELRELLRRTGSPSGQIVTQSGQPINPNLINFAYATGSPNDVYPGAMPGLHAATPYFGGHLQPPVYAPHPTHPTLIAGQDGQPSTIDPRTQGAILADMQDRSKSLHQVLKAVSRPAVRRLQHLHANHPDAYAHAFGAANPEHLGNGVISIEEFDRAIFNDLTTSHRFWSLIPKKLAPGETTGGFEQTGRGAATTAAPRSLGYTPTNPVRAALPRRNIKAIYRDIPFGIFDRSIAAQQGNRFGDLHVQDVADTAMSCLDKWSNMAFEGDEGTDATQFDGLRQIIPTSVAVAATESVYIGISKAVRDMVNTETRDVQPSHILINAWTAFMLERELILMGKDGLNYTTMAVGNSVMEIAQISTPGGMLPLVIENFNKPVTGAPDVYKAFVVTMPMLAWEYVQVFGRAGANPATFLIALTNALEEQNKTLMFGAVSIKGAANHHRVIDITDRTSVVDPTTSV